jgi:hypothetical protein
MVNLASLDFVAVDFTCRLKWSSGLSGSALKVVLPTKNWTHRLHFRLIHRLVCENSRGLEDRTREPSTGIFD